MNSSASGPTDVNPFFARFLDLDLRIMPQVAAPGGCAALLGVRKLEECNLRPPLSWAAATGELEVGQISLAVQRACCAPDLLTLAAIPQVWP